MLIFNTQMYKNYICICGVVLCQWTKIVKIVKIDKKQYVKNGHCNKNHISLLKQWRTHKKQI